MKDNSTIEEWIKKGYRELEELGRPEEALKAFNKVLEIDPDRVEAWIWKGVTRLLQ